jgi:hypothetical protein
MRAGRMWVGVPRIRTSQTGQRSASAGARTRDEISGNGIGRVHPVGVNGRAGVGRPAGTRQALTRGMASQGVVSGWCRVGTDQGPAPDARAVLVL